MSVLHSLWRKLTPSRAIELAGTWERAFFESVYRLSFFTGLSTSDDYVKYTIYCRFMRIVTSLLLCCEMWRLSDNLSLDELISCVNVVFIHLLTIWKLKIMLANKDIFKKLQKALESPGFDVSTQNRKKIVEYWANTHKKYLQILLTLAYLTLVAWDVYPLVDEVEYNLMVDVKLPIKYDSPICFAITYVIVGFLFSYASLLVIMSEVIMQAHLIPLICQYAVLADCFENVFQECAVGFEDKNRSELMKDKKFELIYLKRLGALVAQHQNILAQTMDLKAILSAPMLGQLTCSSLLICFVGYQAMTTIAENVGKFVMSLFYLGYTMFTLYLICRWCEEVTVQSQRIGESAYFSGWESGVSQVPGARASMILVIARANKPLVFLAGGMYPLSLSSYTNLVKTSYSALNILLSTGHE